MAWDEATAWLAGAASKGLYQDLLDDAASRPTRMMFRNVVLTAELVRNFLQGRPKAPPEYVAANRGPFLPRRSADCNVRPHQSSLSGCSTARCVWHQTYQQAMRRRCLRDNCRLPYEAVSFPIWD